jgi:hypothetical protein
VSGLLAWAVAAFIAPAVPGVGPPGRAGHAAEGPPLADATGSVAVLARPADAWVAGGAVALGLHAPAVICVGAGRPGVVAPGTAAARRLASRLAGRGHDARASGRLVLVRTDEAGEADRVEAVAGATVLRVFAGARDEDVDARLGAADRVLVAASAADDAVALLSADLLGADVLRADAPATARGLAATGVALAAPLRQRADVALRGLR